MQLWPPAFSFRLILGSSPPSGQAKSWVHGGGKMKSKMCVFAAELLHIPPGSKDAAVFSPAGDKGSSASPGQPASPPLPPIIIPPCVAVRSFCHDYYTYSEHVNGTLQ